LSYTDTLLKIANSLGFDLSTPINSSSTWFLNNSQNLNSVLNLIFLRTESEKFNNHLISLDSWSPLDYVSLLMSIIMEKEFIQEKKWFIIRNSNQEKEFVNKLRYRIGLIETTNITNCEKLEHIT